MNFNLRDEYGNRTLFGKIVTYGLLAFAVYVTFSIVMNSAEPVVALGFIIIIWAVAIVIFKRRKVLVDWNESEQPLKEYISAKKNEGVQTMNKARSNNLDAANAQPLTAAEAEHWNKTVDAFYEETYTKISRKNKKKPRK